jgi:putative tryptophan/tyrosine transport system substrate-binding protein
MQIGLAVVLAISLVLAPLASEAQQVGTVYRIGVLGTASAPYEPFIGSFRHRLRELGYEENKTLLIEYRWADGKLERLPGLAAELVALRVDVIVTHASSGARAAKEATTTIPIVAATMGDPVQDGLAASLARPGGNLTGFVIENVEQPTKFELVVNLKTAKALGVTIPQSVLVRADEIID